MHELTAAVDEIAGDVGLSGVIRVDVGGETVVERAYGLAQRALGIANRPDMQYGVASGAKTFTALAVMSLTETGELSLQTTARSLLGDDLPLIDDRVTVKHLLCHRSGIGDYLDENVEHDLQDYLLAVPMQNLATTEQYVPVLDGVPTKFAPGERFEYCNGGFVVLALMAERASGVAYHDLVQQRVLDPAGLRDIAFLRSDELPGRAALGYVYDDGLRTNVFHLPVRGNGDGGIYVTLADSHALWDALYAGRIVSPANVELMTRDHSGVADPTERYGLGFWLDTDNDAVSMHGFDTGAGFVSVHRHAAGITHTTIANTTRGAWPVSQRLAELLR